jgi:hypothetical protein
MFQLSYSGQREVTQNQAQNAHDLLNKLLELHNEDTVVSVDVGQIRPQSDRLLLVISLSARADMPTLMSVRDELANELLDLGIESDIETAKANIEVSG